MTWMSIVVSVVISYLASTLFFGGYIKHIFHDDYVISQVLFFSQTVLYCLVINISQCRTHVRYATSISIFYISCYITYHLIHVVSHGLGAWLYMLKVHNILIVFTPNCLVGLLVSLVFIVSLEMQIKISVWKGSKSK